MTDPIAAPGPVSPSDVTEAVRLAVEALRPAVSADWSGKAGDLEWDCWETAEHLADDLFAYAGQLAPSNPPQDGNVPFGWERKHPDGPILTIYVDRTEGAAALLQVLDASATFLAAVVAFVPATTRAHHTFGVSDPEGFAAMGVVETLIHTRDLAEGLGVDWTPPVDLCSRVLARLFPDAPTDTDPWSALLWSTGRIELPGRPRLTKWRWYGAPRER